MDSQLAIHTIKESCYQVGYPTHDKEHERRKLINQSCDYAIECINKLNKIEQIVRDHDNDSMPEDYWYIDKIREEVLNNESNN